MENDFTVPLPANTDIDSILSEGDLVGLASVIGTQNYVSYMRYSLADLVEGRPDDELDASGITVGEMRARNDRVLSGYADIPTLQALRAVHLASEEITRARWRTIHAARVEGASWSAIGDVLGMSKQGAQDWYNKRAAMPESGDTE